MTESTECRTWPFEASYDDVDIYWPLAYLGLARAYAVQQDITSARRAYQDLFTLWKNADTDTPALKQAKAEYAKLQ